MHKQLRYWMILLLALGVQSSGFTQGVKAEHDKALVMGDYLRVRTSPNAGGELVGVLFKNMLVDISARSEEKTEIKGKSYYWYKVEHESLTGWCYGKFLSFYIPSKIPDTYYAKPDMKWYYKKFGYGTSYMEAGIKVNTFSMDEYRKLMAATAKGDSGAWTTLHLSIYPHLKKDPDDKAYQYLKKKLYSREFIYQAYKNSRYVDNSFNNLPKKLLDDDSLYEDLKKLPHSKWWIKFHPRNKKSK